MEIRTIAVGQLAANCYLVIDEATRDTAVIDPGDEPGKIEHEIRAAGANPKYILLTHGHPDHSYAAGQIQMAFEVDTLMHKADVPQLEGEPDIVALFFDPRSYVRPRLGRFLSDGDTISLGAVEIRVIHTPGHSPGSLCYVMGDAAFTGDTLFAGGVGRTDLAGGSYEDLVRSIHDKLLVLPDETIIYPGHGPASTIGAERG